MKMYSDSGSASSPAVADVEAAYLPALEDAALQALLRRDLPFWRQVQLRARGVGAPTFAGLRAHLALPSLGEARRVHCCGLPLRTRADGAARGSRPSENAHVQVLRQRSL